jgi:1,4-dihydroxy-2-naphthoyl-CoA hydrolase
MLIWKTKPVIEILNQMRVNTMTELLGIEFTEAGDDFLSAHMPVDHRTHQPMGYLHGGASCAIAETVGSVAANCCVDFETEYCMGMDIHTSHLRPLREGMVTATARPIHIGKRTQVWEIRQVDEQNNLVAITQLRVVVLQR